VDIISSKGNMMMPVLRLGIVGAALLGLILQRANAYTVLSPGAIVAGKSITLLTADGGPGVCRLHSMPIHCSIPLAHLPAGTPILLPMLNLFDVEPSITPPPVVTLDDRKTAADAVVQAWLGAVIKSSLFASIDGNTVANPADYLAATERQTSLRGLVSSEERIAVRVVAFPLPLASVHQADAGWPSRPEAEWEGADDRPCWAGIRCSPPSVHRPRRARARGSEAGLEVDRQQSD
jgi:hypothetical protein